MGKKKKKNYVPVRDRAPETSTRREKEKKMNGWGRVVIWLMPLMIIFLVSAINLRGSGVINTTLKATPISTYSSLQVQDNEFRGAIKTYMQHGSDELTLMTSDKKDAVDVFTAEDKAVVKNVRKLADILLGFGIAFAVLTLLAYIFLLKREEYQIHMKALKRSAAWMFVFGGFWLLVRSIPSWRTGFWYNMVGFNSEGDSLLTQFVSSGYFKYLSIYEIITVLIVAAAVAYITWEFAGKRAR